MIDPMTFDFSLIDSKRLVEVAHSLSLGESSLISHLTIPLQERKKANSHSCLRRDRASELKDEILTSSTECALRGRDRDDEDVVTCDRDSIDGRCDCCGQEVLRQSLPSLLRRHHYRQSAMVVRVN